MSFNMKNSYIGIVEDPTVFSDPDQDLVPAKIRLLGICTSDSGDKVDEDKSVRASFGDNFVVSHKIDVDMKVATKLLAATKTAIETDRVSLVYLNPNQWEVTKAELMANEVLDAANLKVAQGSFDYRIIRPLQLNMPEDYKPGTGDVSLIQIKGSASGALTKDELRKEKVM